MIPSLHASSPGIVQTMHTQLNQALDSINHLLFDVDNRIQSRQENAQGPYYVLDFPVTLDKMGLITLMDICRDANWKNVAVENYSERIRLFLGLGAQTWQPLADM